MEETEGYSSSLPRMAAVAKTVASVPMNILSTALGLVVLPILVHPLRLSVVRQMEAPVDKKGRPLGKVINGKTEVDEGKGSPFMPIVDTCDVIPTHMNNKHILPFIPVHGFRSNKTGVRFLTEMVKNLCAQGIATHAFDNPGTGNSKGVLNTPKRTLRALESVYLNVRSKGTDDGEKSQYALAPVIGGFSLGSLAAGAFAANSKEPVSGLFLESPIIDLEEYLATDMGLGNRIAKRIKRMITLGSNHEKNQIYNLMELIPKLDHVPILISYSKDDPVVNSKQVNNFCKAIKAHRKENGIETPIQVIERESDRHMGGFYKNPEEYMNEFVTFFRHNQRTFQPNPKKRLMTRLKERLPSDWTRFPPLTRGKSQQHERENVN